MVNIFVYLTFVFWIIMLFYWIFEAKSNSQTRFSSEIASILKLTFSFLIIYLPLLIGGWFATQLYSVGIYTGIMGIILCGFGIFFAILGRRALGTNWSGKIMIQNKHHLIQTGPYSLVRHPQYTGDLLALFGTTIVLGQVFGFIWFVFMLFGLIWKSEQEEEILTKKFSGEYLKYKRRVKMIIPYLL